MFAYCQNNPLFYLDVSGALPVPVPTLVDFYNMHKQVQYDINQTYGYAIEVYVWCWYTRGFLDVYDPSTNQYYEIKTRAQIDSAGTENQMKKYDTSQIRDWRFIGYNFSSTPKRGTNDTISGTCQYSYWDITYRFSDDGKIYYDYQVNESRYRAHMSLYLAAVTGLAVGFRAGGVPDTTLSMRYHCLA